MYQYHYQTIMLGQFYKKEFKKEMFTHNGTGGSLVYSGEYVDVLNKCSGYCYCSRNPLLIFYDTITCTTPNIIYLISCRVCNIQYVGETKNSLKKRIYGHRSTIKTGRLDTPVGCHFKPTLSWVTCPTPREGAITNRAPGNSTKQGIAATRYGLLSQH